MLIRIRLKFIIHLSIDLIYRMALYKSSMKEKTLDYGELIGKSHKPKVYVIQEIPGRAKDVLKLIFWELKNMVILYFYYLNLSQIIFSPGPLIFKLRTLLKNYTLKDYLLLTGDPAIIGVACSIVSDITNGKYKLLKWDKQERKYYSIDINLT